jgi:hypothetical protein
MKNPADAQNCMNNTKNQVLDLKIQNHKVVVNTTVLRPRSFAA